RIAVPQAREGRGPDADPAGGLLVDHHADHAEPADRRRHRALSHAGVAGRRVLAAGAGMGSADRGEARLARQNALKVMMVRVSWMSGIVCTFSFTKCPMSVPSST